MSCCLWTAEADVRKKKFQSSKLILGPKTPLFLGVLALVCTICVGGCKRSWPLITLTFAFCLLPLIAFHPLGVKVPKSKLIRSHERCLLLKSAGQWPWKSESAKECVTARGWQSKESYWPRRLCVRHPRWRLQCVAGHCYYYHTFPFRSTNQCKTVYNFSQDLPIGRFCLIFFMSHVHRYSRDWGWPRRPRSIAWKSVFCLL